jgi:DNA-binding CsgD family transcriptional regulator
MVARAKRVSLDLDTHQCHNHLMAQWSTEERAEFRKKVWNLRLGGYSGVEIAEELGISTGSVFQLLKQAREAISETAAASALEERKEAVGRLDTLLRSIWPSATEGDIKAVSAALAIEDRSAKLQGLDAAAKTAMDLTSGGEPIKFTVTIPRVMRVDDTGTESE